MKRWSFVALALLLAGALAGGCSTLDTHQREWIFQPSDRSWGNTADLASGMDEVWIDYTPRGESAQVRLHGLWLGGKAPSSPQTPVLLYLHGARYNVAGSAPRMQRMHELGFAVLAVDYRGFGKSTKALPSEDSAREDAMAAWKWLAEHHPKQARYIFGHSLGGAIGIDLASRVDDEAGTIVEGTFSSIADVVSTFKWGWLPFKPLITQPFDSMARVKQIGSPLLVVHGSLDSLIRPELGRKLYDAAASPKLFVLVQGGSHFSTNSVGHDQYRAALSQLFRMSSPDTLDDPAQADASPVTPRS
ncbi:alpha/beta fold hydrolase [Variovorax dokdonensis]|uniref:Alpha/beta fold hydrolase n=1 Tax=Variovorax dokdonensis TaxID=344883 RepID=A0ABT7NEL5_9BURK|nr:alpha/beta fold hydrolase [Variovorax dokdonensis]MDM0046396.1 alpha/beta fold hydrolase [Variovorax dokdonensis]